MDAHFLELVVCAEGLSCTFVGLQLQSTCAGVAGSDKRCLLPAAQLHACSPALHTVSWTGLTILYSCWLLALSMPHCPASCTALSTLYCSR
jgi:hypothetical protein